MKEVKFILSIIGTLIILNVISIQLFKDHPESQKIIDKSIEAGENVFIGYELAQKINDLKWWILLMIGLIGLCYAGYKKWINPDSQF